MKKQTQIPSEVKIGGHLVTVKFDNLKDANGEFDWNTNTISLEKDLPDDQKQSAFIHECLHAMNSSWGDGDFGHALLDSLSEQIYQLLRDNDIYFYKQDKLSNNENTKPTQVK